MRSLVALALFAGTACSTSPSSDRAPDPNGTPKAGATAGDDAGEDAGVRPLDPALFDCSARSRPLPPAPANLACVRDPKCRGRFVAGHRGAGGELGRLAPEGSLAAYRAAYAIGAELVETDPRPTADGVIVNVHDSTVDRTTDGKGEVAKMTLAEVQKLRLVADKYPGDFSCEKIPTLEDVLAQSKDHAIVLVDANKTDRVDALVEAITKTDTLEWAIFDTSDTAKIDRALLLEPRLMIQIRPQKAEDIAPLVAKYAAHPPVFVEIDQRVFPNGVEGVHAAGLRVFTNAFVADIGVRLGTSTNAAYLPLFEEGADALQSDLPDEVARSLGRTVPAH